jgi:NAD(P)-dependent dehydrogenase (short-subunit alcohol dehydrogenase family)
LTEKIQLNVIQLDVNKLLGRPCMPDKIAKALVFLASDDSSYSTCIELFVDDGGGDAV